MYYNCLNWLSSSFADELQQRLGKHNVFTVAKKTIEGHEFLYQSIKLTNGIWCLSEIKMQSGSVMVSRHTALSCCHRCQLEFFPSARQRHLFDLTTSADIISGWSTSFHYISSVYPVCIISEPQNLIILQLCINMYSVYCPFL